MLIGLAGCKKAQSALLYETVAVERRDVVLTSTTTGVIEPIITFSVKSKAWGEILEMPVQTGDEVKKGQLLVTIDPRIPRDNLTEAQANLSRAQAQLTNATAQFKRSETLYQSQSIAQTDYERARLAYITAQSAVVTAQAQLRTAQEAMDDTHVRAPIAGTVLELDAVRGTVISSPTLGGGTVILKMASLDTVRDSALVVETDIGKVQPGMAVTITVDAFPDRTFEGTVLKIEPQAQINQNVTMFPVRVNIPNPGHLLKPGMNTGVRVHMGQVQHVIAIPNAALRTTRDVASAASVLGLDPQAVEQQLAAAAAAPPPPRAGGDTADRGAARGPGGRMGPLPPGVTPEQVRAAFEKARSGGELTDAERSLLAQVRASRGQDSVGGAAAGARPSGGGRAAGGGRGAGGRSRSQASSSYIVFVVRGRKIIPVSIRTGLSDQDFIEVTSGLTETDSVLVLPSASLVQAQQQFRQRFQSVTGGGLPGLRQQQAPGAPTAR
ncbi:MAG TPA: efflux RND transporter periplasmic adaptor subunit [Gemmatimonadales bacterium]|nr:efflux RND transporter periplasmic adaptor subunit [Gemmatimonadales bacterium]